MSALGRGIGFLFFLRLMTENKGQEKKSLINGPLFFTLQPRFGRLYDIHFDIHEIYHGSSSIIFPPYFLPPSIRNAHSTRLSEDLNWSSLTNKMQQTKKKMAKQNSWSMWTPVFIGTL